MADTFTNYENGVESPARKSFAITPHDSNALAVAPRAIYTGSGGTIVVRLLEDSADVTFSNVPAGTILPIRPDLVKATGTTATGLVGLT